MIVYRLVKKKFASDLSGFGASLYGGRWNKKGIPVIYTGESLEIALLELVVHVPPMMVPALNEVALQIPDNSILELEIKDLPKNWRDYPAPTILTELGGKWIESNQSIALKVPSSIVPSAHNYILNCRHPDFKKIKIIKNQNFKYDPRLSNKGRNK